MGGLKHLLKDCNKYLVFFSTKITIALVLKLPSNHFKKLTNEQKNMKQDPKKDRLFINEELLFSNKFLFESTSDDRKFNSLDELTVYGKNFLVCCLHILFESDLVQDYENAIHTWNWIKSNGKLNISMQTVYDAIRNWMYNPEHEKESVNIKEAEIEAHDSKHFVKVENVPSHVNDHEIDNMTHKYIEMIEEPEILEFKIENLESEDIVIEASGDYLNSHKSESYHVENTIQSTDT